MIDSTSLPDQKKQQIEKRNLISSIFVVILIGIAYAEVVPPIRESVRAKGLTFGTSILFAIFFLTSMRFFMGNQLHLTSEALVKMKGQVWFYDLMVICLQTVLLIFLGGLTSLELNVNLQIAFLELLIALYVLDVLWIISQFLFGKISPNWRREFVPWPWGVLNSGLIALMIFTRSIIRNPYSGAELVSIGLLNLIGFIIDVLLVDYYKVL